MTSKGELLDGAASRSEIVRVAEAVPAETTADSAPSSRQRVCLSFKRVGAER